MCVYFLIFQLSLVISIISGFVSVDKTLTQKIRSEELENMQVLLGIYR